MSNTFQTARKLAELKTRYFSNEKRILILKQGDVLLKGEEHNDKLFLILEGTLSCYLKNEEDKNYEVMKSTRNMFLGVYSFFSYEQKSYLTVIADTNVRLSYIERSDPVVENDMFATDFLPVIVNEIYLRQTLTQQMSREKQAAIQKLYESEKMILLGQLAAGLAHELNNAIGILERNTAWLMETISTKWIPENVKSIFNTTIVGGLSFNSQQIRERAHWLEEKYKLSPKLAKQLAKTNLTESELREVIQGGSKSYDLMNDTTELAGVLHDMQIAAQQATHVVKSVKDLGANRKVEKAEVFLADTIQRALVLVKSFTKSISINLEIQTQGKLQATSGDWVQVWINLIKNGCESMLQANQVHPKINIRLFERDNHYQVEITDNGTGISPEIADKIFQPSFTTKVSGLSFGLGLGLSIVKKIVDSYNGGIQVKSKQGETTFIIIIPKN
ncbi:MAG: ATP-binding protein [Cyclobacteriaceae bacterium]|jgi:signal transduction histidine kinase|nr:ATP-binding protein [Cytophagales bacterium]MCZ8327253.1 ATP-binding protein [Cyclobacteriaceae bacterium]